MERSRTRKDGEVSIRAMSAVDVDRVTDIHVGAFAGFFLTYLGRRFVRLFYSETVALGEIALVAESEGAIVGLVMGSTSPGRFFTRLLQRRAVGFAVAALPAVARRPRILLRVTRALLKPREAGRPVGTATLLSVAVAADAQGLGAGRKLVVAFLEEARRRGATRVDLTTDKTCNDRTNAFYRSLGFQVGREITTPEKRILNEYELRLSDR
jgi:ribosomal protein S18 acetylase RimI-like enzyme